VRVDKVDVRDRHGDRQSYLISGSGSSALDKNLVKADVMQDAAGAARYVAKYVSKNVGNDTVKAWLSVYGIRQYAFFGGGMSRKMWNVLGKAKMQTMVVSRTDSDVLVPSWRETEKAVKSEGYKLLPMINESGYRCCLIDKGMNVIFAVPAYDLTCDIGSVVNSGNGVDTRGDGRYRGGFDADDTDRREENHVNMLQKRNRSFQGMGNKKGDGAVDVIVKWMNDGVMDFCWEG